MPWYWSKIIIESSNSDDDDNGDDVDDDDDEAANFDSGSQYIDMIYIYRTKKKLINFLLEL